MQARSFGVIVRLLASVWWLKSSFALHSFASSVTLAGFTMNAYTNQDMSSSNSNSNRNTMPMVVVFGRPGAGKSTVADWAVDFLMSSEDNNIHVLGLDLDVCVPQWMRDNFAKGSYPTLEERHIFAKGACDYVDEQLLQLQQETLRKNKELSMGVIISFSFVNTDLRETFRQRFPHAQWYLVNTSEEEATLRIQKRQGHFYKGKKDKETATDHKSKRPNRNNNSEWEFAQVDFHHVDLDGNDSIECNAKTVAKGLLNLFE
jgi:adenylate kinase family enzyme